jgi:hypothetical protein
MIIVTTCGRKIGITQQIDTLIRQFRHGDYVSTYSINFAKDLGRRIALAAGTASLIEVANAIEADIDAGHFATLRTLWTAVIDELEADADEDNVPTRDALIVAFETDWGTGTWARCEAAARAAMRQNCRTDRDRLTTQHLARHGIGTDLATAWLVLALEPARPGRPRAGNTKRRLGCG